MKTLKELIGYYDALAGRILYGEITDEQLQTVARYQPGRSFQDITKALRDSNRREDAEGAMV